MCGGFMAVGVGGGVGGRLCGVLHGKGASLGCIYNFCGELLVGGRGLVGGVLVRRAYLAGTSGSVCVCRDGLGRQVNA